MRTASRRPSVQGPQRIRQLLERLRKAESDAVMRERRAAQRTPFVRPVRITLGRESHTDIEAVSSNLSQMGICLVHDVELQAGRTGILTINRLQGPVTRVRAEVRWCTAYCGSWFLSGWRFIAEEPG